MCGHVAELPPSQDASKPANDFTIKKMKMFSMLTEVQVYVITPKDVYPKSIHNTKSIHKLIIQIYTYIYIYTKTKSRYSNSQVYVFTPPKT